MVVIFHPPFTELPALFSIKTTSSLHARAKLMKLAQVHQQLCDNYHGTPVYGLLSAVKECLSCNEVSDTIGIEQTWPENHSIKLATLSISMYATSLPQKFIFTFAASLLDTAMTTVHERSYIF